MKKLFVFLTLISFSFLVNAQNYSDPQNMKVITSQEAHYPKGDQALFNYVYNNIVYSKEALAAEPSGEVTVSFDVEADSSLTGFLVLSKVGYGIDEEIVRVLKTLKFAPSIQNGFFMKMNLMLSFPIKL